MPASRQSKPRRAATSSRATSGAIPDLPDDAWRRTLARRLIAWYRRARRDLPWRHTTDPYRIWVSEIMLQQTQVATVVPYYERFVARFPSVEALAAADEHDVLRLWEGLGYYRRARQLHRAARVVVAEHGGRFPRELEAVAGLPGIGRYTAGAIVSLAFDRPAPILEANTVRLFSRLAGFDGDADSGAGRRFLWLFAEAILPERDCRSFNSALMELGSLVCTPRGPDCQHCPVRELCAGWRAGTHEQLPRPRAKPTIEAVREAAVVVRRGERVLLRKRQPGERWAGLWDFVRFEISRRSGAALTAEIVERVKAQTGLGVRGLEKLATLKHGVTRFRITLECYTAVAAATRLPVEGEFQWVKPEELERFPLSVTGRKLSRLLVDGKAQIVTPAKRGKNRG